MKIRPCVALNVYLEKKYLQYLDNPTYYGEKQLSITKFLKRTLKYIAWIQYALW